MNSGQDWGRTGEVIFVLAAIGGIGLMVGAACGLLYVVQHIAWVP